MNCLPDGAVLSNPVSEATCVTYNSQHKTRLKSDGGIGLQTQEKMHQKPGDKNEVLSSLNQIFHYNDLSLILNLLTQLPPH